MTPAESASESAVTSVPSPAGTSRRIGVSIRDVTGRQSGGGERVILLHRRSPSRYPLGWFTADDRDACPGDLSSAGCQHQVTPPGR